MQNFKTAFEKRVALLRSTLSSMQTYREYIGDKYNKLLSWIGSDPTRDESVLPIPVYDESVESYKICAISKASIDAVYAGTTDPINVVDTTGATMAVDAEEISEIVTDTVADLKVQSIFLDEMLKGGEANASAFCAKVRALVPEIQSNILETYSIIIDNANTPLEAIKTYVDYVHDTFPVEDPVTQVVSIANKGDYVGNAALAAWCMPGEAIINWVSKLSINLSSIKAFFESVWSEIKQVTKWIAGKLFGDLNTNYTKASDAVVGKLDLPIFQIGFTRQSAQDLLTHLRDIADDGDYFYSCDGYAYRMKLQNITPYALYIATMIDNLPINSDYPNITQIFGFTVPSTKGLWDTRFEIGVGPNGYLCLSGYIVVTYQELSKFADTEVTEKVFESFSDGLRYVSSFVPMGIQQTIPAADPIDSSYTSWMLASLPFFADPSLQTSNDLGECLQILRGDEDYVAELVGKIVGETVTNSEKTIAAVTAGILLYGIRYGKGCRVNDVNYDTYINAVLFNPDNFYTPSAGDSTIEYDTTDMVVPSSDDYYPYTLGTSLANAVHYQTITEQAAEIVRHATRVALVALFVATTITIAKWRLKRKRIGALKQAAVDSAAWTYASNPSNSNYQAYNTAYKSNRRYQRLNSVLGLVSSNAANAVAEGNSVLTRFMADSSKKVTDTTVSTQGLIKLMNT